MKTRAVLTALLALLGGIALAQFDFAKVDNYIQTQMSRNGIPGVSIAITQGDQIIYLKGYGTAGRGQPMTSETPMYIGSTSKSFTALAVMQLVEQGKVELDAPVQKYIPWFTLADEEAAKIITLRHLLSHTSGLSDLQYVEIGRLPDSASIEEGVRDLRVARLVDPAGTKFHYFNPGYATLGLIVEKVSGLSYDEYLKRNILEPLGMTRTYTEPETAQRAGLAQGHSLMFGFTVPRTQPFRRYGVPDGYIISTARDMARYLMALNNGGALEGRRVLSAAGMLELFSSNPAAPFYAKGWMVGQYRGLRLIQHGGANEFFKHEAMMLPGRGIGLVMQFNQGYLPSAFYVYNPMALGVLDVLLGEQPANIPVGLPLTMRQFGGVLLAVLFVQLSFIAWSFSRLPRWRERARTWSALRRTLDIALNFLITPLIALGIYFFMREFMGRGFSLRQSFDGVPDAVLLLMVGFVADYIQGLYKLWTLTRQNRLGEVGKPYPAT